MNKLARTVVSVTAAACVVAAAPAALAADGDPLTYAQVQSDPTTLAANAAITTVMDGPFTMTGKQFDAKGGVVVSETLTHKGSLYRIAATRPGVGTRVVISDGKRSCVRTVAKASAAKPSKDRAARWTCGSGVDALLSGELLAITPLGMAQVLDTQTGGLIRFAPATNAAGAYELGLLNSAGARAGAYTMAGPAGGPFQVTIAQGATVAGTFTVAPQAAGTIAPLRVLKK